MKKYFMFVAVAAAGMLASCSSESLTAGSDPTIEPTQEERVPIQLSVSSPSVRATTRGTGTVGGVGTSTNVWAGQEIRAFMFKKGEAALTPATETDNSTILYKNALMITPGVATNKTPGGSSSTDIGEAMLSDGAIKYYPPKGNFDFFGYHGDDATGALNESSPTLWTVPFTIDGSQDLMSTKAKLLEQEDPGTIKQETAMGTSTDYYSAKAARKGVQPILQFDHLLSRLSFVVVPGNDNAGGWVATTIPAVLYADAAEYNAAKGTTLTEGEFAALSDEDKIKTPAVPAHQDASRAVYVKEITVNSKTKGDMAVAWTDAPDPMINWDSNSDADLKLKERPAVYSLNSDPTNAAEYKTKAQYDLLADGPTDGDKNDKTDYSPTTDNANFPLVTLTPTYPKMTHAYDAENLEPTPIGEALIVAPKKAEAYKMKVTVVQKVPTNWNTIDDPTTYDDKEMTYDLDIDAPGDDPATDENEAEFKANTSYKVVLTVYGFERIQVTTMIIPWDEYATPINVGQD